MWFAVFCLCRQGTCWLIICGERFREVQEETIKLWRWEPTAHLEGEEVVALLRQSECRLAGGLLLPWIFLLYYFMMLLHITAFVTERMYLHYCLFEYTLKRGMFFIKSFRETLERSEKFNILLLESEISLHYMIDFRRVASWSNSPHQKSQMLLATCKLTSRHKNSDERGE